MLGLVREKEKLERTLGGIKNMDALPTAVFLIDVGHEEIAVREARKLSIPVVAVVDTNCSPEGIDYPIPGNDDAMRAIQLYAEGIADAVIDGKASIPEVPTGDDEFVELDESGKPKVEAKPQRKAPPKKRARVTKVRSKGRARPTDEAPAEGAEEESEAE
jgi:small subunit ribosomal protein S2